MSSSAQVSTRDRAAVLARLDRLPRRTVSYAATGIVGLAMFVIFYCNFDINVSFLQTCGQIVDGCAPVNAQSWLPLPVCAYLAGYVLGCLVVAPLSDRLGRRPVLAASVGFAALGSLIAAVAGDYATFTTGRAVTGIAMGAVLAVGNTYIGELAPHGARARYTATTFVLCTLGAMVGIGLGLMLTTQAAPFPEGMPVAFGLANGWRWIHWVAVFLGALAVAATLRLPESPRWLVEHGRIGDADAVMTRLEARAKAPLPEPDPSTVPPPVEHARHAYRELFVDPRYRRRALLLIAMWFTGYATVFSYSTGSTVVLTSLHFTPPVAGMISAAGGVGFFVQGLFSARYSEVLERRYWLPVGAAMTVLGAVIIALLGTDIGWALAGSFLVFFGFNVWVPPTFALSAESFPTRIRSAGFGLVDGIGVLGGATGVLVVAPLVPLLAPLPALLLVSSFLVVAAVLAQFTPRTRNRALEELSP
ncbi:MFS transporter [Kutzneria sp. CA-103260]|uniref:MFS transporter n=1 Tax=Kutzneria sp. CA-103260 TaxID=2802641 RepID=UPI001BAC6B7B|nr:MFS transporter [Kutzneria sp. CA-103260]QUQ65903.1 MFS transporter metabolite:H+ symporter [Kutzneria sp. CA-103260]